MKLLGIDMGRDRDDTGPGEVPPPVPLPPVGDPMKYSPWFEKRESDDEESGPPLPPPAPPPPPLESIE